MITCILEHGHKVSFRHVVVNVIVKNNNKVLLTRRAPHLPAGGKYGLPGGFMDRDETLEEAAVREVFEETGYEVELTKLLRVVDNPDRKGEDRQNVMFLYLARPIKKTGSPDKESSEVGWFDLNALPRSSEFAFDHLEQIELHRESS